MLKLHSRMDAVQAPIVPVVADWIRQNPGTISLGQGVVRYGPPAAALDAARAALDDPALSHYSDVTGLPELIDRIVLKLEQENGVRVGEDRRVMVTAGANMAFVHAIAAITEPGDEVILPVPFYFNHDMAIDMAGCRAVPVPTDASYQLRMGAIRAAITPRTRAIVTISPNNPSGAVFPEASLRAVNALCAERGLYHIADEVYEYFTYASARHVSPSSFGGSADHTFSIYSLSKAYGFAGWRIGYIVYPAHLASAMVKAQDTVLVCPPVVSQIAAAAALESGRAYCEPFVEELATVRRVVLDALTALGPMCEVPSSDGAFYVLLRVHTDRDPMAVAEQLIRDHRVAVIPGPAFGVVRGCSLRIAYGALAPATVREGVGRLVDGLQTLLS